MSRPESRRQESIRLLAHSLERVMQNRVFDIEHANPGVKVVPPTRDYMAVAERLYDDELDKLVMERCEAVIDGMWRPAAATPPAARMIDPMKVPSWLPKVADALAEYMEKNYGSPWKFGKIQSREGS